MFDEVFSNPRSVSEEDGDKKPLKKNTDSYQAQHVASEVVEGAIETEKYSIGQSIQANLIFLIVAALVELQSLGFVWGKNGGAMYANFLGFVSLVVGVGLIVLQTKSPLVAKGIEPPACLFLFAWWLLGALITTFIGPFLDVGNGYFAVWGSLLVSANLTTLSYQQLSPLTRLAGSSQSKSSLLTVAIGSGILLTASALLCYNNPKKCNANGDYTLPVAFVSIAILVVMHFSAKKVLSFATKHLALALAGVWGYMTYMTTTEKGVYADVGNGYFAVWVCCLGSVHLAYVEWMASKDK